MGDFIARLSSDAEPTSPQRRIASRPQHQRRRGRWDILRSGLFGMGAEIGDAMTETFQEFSNFIFVLEAGVI